MIHTSLTTTVCGALGVFFALSAIWSSRENTEKWLSISVLFLFYYINSIAKDVVEALQ